MTSKSAVWHPFTQHGLDPPATAITSGEWHMARNARRQTHHRRDLVVVGDHARTPPSGHRGRRSRTARQARSGHLCGLHARAGRAAGRKADSARACRPHPRLLFRQRLHVGRSRSQDGARLLAQHRRDAHRRCSARARLSRRHHRHDVRRQPRRLQRRLCATAVRRRPHPVSVRRPRAGNLSMRWTPPAATATLQPSSPSR